MHSNKFSMLCWTSGVLRQGLTVRWQDNTHVFLMDTCGFVRMALAKMVTKWLLLTMINHEEGYVIIFRHNILWPGEQSTRLVLKIILFPFQFITDEQFSPVKATLSPASVFLDSNARSQELWQLKRSRRVLPLAFPWGKKNFSLSAGTSERLSNT